MDATRAVLRRRAAEAARLAALSLALACGLMPPQQGEPGAASPQVTLPPAGYRLLWSDDFTGSALDPSSWTALTGPRHQAVMVRDAVTVGGGVLTLRTYTDASGVHHTGFVSSDGKVGATYGYFEARIKFEDAPGEWCAFWLESPTNGTPLGDPGAAGVEIDVVEHRVTDQGGWTALADMVAMNLNWDGYGPDRQNRQKVTAVPDVPKLQGEWHTYGVLWEPEGYRFYVDGHELWNISDAISRRSETIELSCEVSDRDWAGNVPAGGYGPRDASTTGMQVDWVRIWQKPP